MVAIHNKNGQGFLLTQRGTTGVIVKSQSTIKMDKVSYTMQTATDTALFTTKSQSTIKMDKVSYELLSIYAAGERNVAIHNKNGQGFLLYV